MLSIVRITTPIPASGSAFSSRSLLSFFVERDNPLFFSDFRIPIDSYMYRASGGLVESCALQDISGNLSNGIQIGSFVNPLGADNDRGYIVRNTVVNKVRLITNPWAE